MIGVEWGSCKIWFVIYFIFVIFGHPQARKRGGGSLCPSCDFWNRDWDSVVLSFDVQLTLASLRLHMTTVFLACSGCVIHFLSKAFSHVDCNFLTRITSPKKHADARWTHLYQTLELFFLLTITWLIQVKDGKLLDEMAVSVTGLANKVGWADVCHTGAKPVSWATNATSHLSHLHLEPAATCLHVRGRLVLLWKCIFEQYSFNVISYFSCCLFNVVSKIAVYLYLNHIWLLLRLCWRISFFVFF